MPLFQSSPKQPALALTKDSERIIAYVLTTAAVRRLRDSGVRHGRKFPATILASLIRTGDAHSPRPADHAGQISLFGDDDTVDQLPRCEVTGSTLDLHLVVYAEASGAVAKLLSTEPRFLFQKVTKLSIPVWALNSVLLGQLEATGKLPPDSTAAKSLRQWFRRNYDAAWEKLLATNSRQDHLDLGNTTGELAL